jgi:hypothetical protein
MVKSKTFGTWFSFSSGFVMQGQRIFGGGRRTILLQWVELTASDHVQYWPTPGNASNRWNLNVFLQDIIYKTQIQRNSH